MLPSYANLHPHYPAPWPFQWLMLQYIREFCNNNLIMNKHGMLFCWFVVCVNIFVIAGQGKGHWTAPKFAEASNSASSMIGYAIKRSKTLLW